MYSLPRGKIYIAEVSCLYTSYRSTIYRASSYLNNGVVGRIVLFVLGVEFSPLSSTYPKQGKNQPHFTFYPARGRRQAVLLLRNKRKETRCYRSAAQCSSPLPPPLNSQLSAPTQACPNSFNKNEQTRRIQTRCCCQSSPPALCCPY